MMHNTGYRGIGGYMMYNFASWYKQIGIISAPVFVSMLVVRNIA